MAGQRKKRRRQPRARAQPRRRARGWGAGVAVALVAVVAVALALRHTAAPRHDFVALRLPPPPSAVLPAPPVVPPRPAAPQRIAPPPLPAWQRYATAAAPAAGRPEIAIVIDDLGIDHARTARAIALASAVTLSFMTYADGVRDEAAAARRAGHELIVHVPMEPLSRSEDMGPNGLAIDLPRAELQRRLDWDLARFDGYVGINNHMGSRFTADADGMALVLATLKARGLLFLDSRTSPDSVGARIARRLDVPFAARDVFLDDDERPQAIAAQLALTEEAARRHGTAIAIGHPHDATLAVLAHWIATLPAKHLVLVPLTAIVAARDGAPAATAAR
jgi:uncharacterized protein